MSHITCACGDTVPIAKNTDVHFHIGVWCGNCNQKYTFVFREEGGQTSLWARVFLCHCDARRYGECSCDPRTQEGEEVVQE